ncbi:TonB-dependent Receptor Plug Domain protein [Salinivirga cyanobacteriivorans]|uniref:TonB-dependent Receptor Plug Domain protein n=1 Tax=Salinivirga cyanobacteriivorans TaxID=1307839 RepID=A0A0S2HW13_9BACT|nr:carboxypeptidase-like regulatory domain-containing protein [Salinivirga cyanobacteriivorans]ALO14202.1 TonB-dependent Receptor Plug Domain protein [Salinivirga cyanobacteriivorans]
MKYLIHNKWRIPAVYMLLIFAGLQIAQAQQTRTIDGVVVDQATGEPLPGANIILQSDIFNGTTTDARGKFTIHVAKNQWQQDSLITSFLGYHDRTIAVKEADQSHTITLKPKAEQLEEAVVVARRIIAEEFTIKKMKQIDIYLNPIAKADPLLAVNAMPASTTTDESASISLRGSSPAETGIFFNGVPIYDAVRFSQLNGIGTFSIFNTAIVERMHVFPSNPPLEYGNTSSGLISIQSKSDLPKQNQHSISLSLANLGGQMVRKMGDKTGITVFANYQPSAALIGVNEQAFDNLKSFYAADAGIHVQHQINTKTRLKLFNYTNLEGYEYKFRHASFSGIFDQQKRRNFTIINLNQKLPAGEFNLNTGASFSHEKYDYGNTLVNMDKQDLYAGISYIHFFDKLSVKTGISNDSRLQKLDGSFPVFGYALGNDLPAIDYAGEKSIDVTEAFTYGKYEFNANWISGLGIRKNLPYTNQKNYWSGQWNVNYSFLKHHALNASVGRYHRYALPNAETEKVTFYRSDQISLDYSLETDIVELTAAAFAKNVKFDQTKEHVNGAELFTKLFLFQNRVTFQASYTLIDARRTTNGSSYSSPYDLEYFVRGSLKYQHHSNLDISLIMLYRQGQWYQPVIDRNYDAALDVYEPVYTSRNNMTHYPDYLKLDLSLSKLWPVSSRLNIIGFMNVSNLLDTENVRDLTYNHNYTDYTYDLFSRRTVYFGGIVNF